MFKIRKRVEPLELDFPADDPWECSWHNYEFKTEDEIEYNLLSLSVINLKDNLDVRLKLVYDKTNNLLDCEIKKKFVTINLKDREKSNHWIGIDIEDDWTFRYESYRQLYSEVMDHYCNWKYEPRRFLREGDLSD